jgi:RHS repeat-associated protein
MVTGRRYRTIGSIAVLGLLAFAGACGQEPAPEPEGRREASETRIAGVISDQTNGGGKTGFYWIPPIVTAAATFTTLDQTGGANNLSVTVDQLLADTSTAPKTSFTGAAITMVTGGSHASFPGLTGPFYGVNWAAGTGVVSGEIYRVTVRALTPARVLGVADVQVVANTTQAGQVDRTKFTPLIVGNSLAIVFRLENKDTDGDTLNDWRDNCVFTKNINQLDSDADGRGNACQCLNVPNGTACSTGCKTGMTCQSGACTGGSNVANGTACATGNLCKQSETCTNGVCGGGSNRTGSCSTGNPCKQSETCSSGVCGGGSNRTGSCSTGNPCKQSETCSSGVCGGGSNRTGSCSTGNPCRQSETCSSGVCGGGSNRPNGSACGDGNLCTQTDTCQSGICTGGSPIACLANDCHDSGTCNKTTGACPARKANGTTCTDSNACTQTDTCQAGVCTGANPVVCTASDQCHDVGVCNTGTGVCSNPSKPNGTACDDGNPCRVGDVCNAGTCQWANPFTCQAPDTCHDVGTCDPGRPLPAPPSMQDLLGWWKLDGNGEDATPGNHDLANEGAVAAPGRSGMAMRFDGTSCMTAPIWEEARMQGASGVTIMAWINPDVYVCDEAHDMNAIAGRGWDYSIGALCASNVPSNYGQGIVGHIRPANPIGWGYGGGYGSGLGWHHVAVTWDHETMSTFLDGRAIAGSSIPGDISDFDPRFAVGCMTSWYFTGDDRVHHFHGAIDEVMLYRRALSPQQIATYYAEADPCTHVAFSDGTSCSDNNLCTQADTCSSGTCVGGAPVVCTAPDSCHDAATCVSWGGCYNPPVKADGAACTDGQVCTQGETCSTGACQAPANPRPVVLDLPVEHLGGLGGPQSFAYDINSSGVAVGWGSTYTPPIVDPSQNHAWRSTGPGTITNLAAELGLGAPSSAVAINDAGTIVGFQTVDGVSHIFRHGAAGLETSFTELHDTIQTYNWGDGIVLHAGYYIRGSFPTEINNAGDFVGHYTLGGKFRGFRFTGAAGMQDVDTLAPNGTTFMYGISESGTAVGAALEAEGDWESSRAVLYDNDIVGLRDLNSIAFDPQDEWTLLSAASIEGDFVVGGALRNGRSTPYRMRLSSGAIDDLSGGWLYQSAAKVNAAGDVVGDGAIDAAAAAVSRWSAFVYTDQIGFKNLDDVISHGSSWSIFNARSINDAGEIVGWGIFPGGWGCSPYRVKLPPGAAASCTARNTCGGGDGDPICLYSDGVVEMSPGHFVAVFGFDNPSSTTVQPTINEAHLVDPVGTPQPAPPTHLPPGTHTGAYLPKFDAGQTVSWTVNGETVTARASDHHLTPVPLPGGGIGVVIAGRTIIVQAGLDPYRTPPNPTTGPTAQAEPQHVEPFNGVLNGQFGVAPSGAATYTVPISVPPGIAGMAPNLNLVYNSQAGMGLAGQGWELTGLSIIHRCPKSRIQDGLGHQVTMDPGDKDEGICLDGKRLFEQGNNSGTYKLELDDHSTITKVFANAPNPDQPLTDVWFKVVTKTGETRYYGQNPRTRAHLQESSQVAVWALERAMDSWGNYFEVHYNHGTTNFWNDGLYVTAIDYTGHVPTQSSGSTGETAPFAHVVFDYEARRETRAARFGTGTLPRRTRLRSITTSVDISNVNTMAGRYYLTYAADYRRGMNYAADNDAMLPTRLTTIDYCAGQNCPAAPPNTLQEKRQQGFVEPLAFEWDGGGYRWDPAPDYAPPEPINRTPDSEDHQPTSHGSAFVDLDGDGRLDFVRSRGGTDSADEVLYTRAWHNTGHGFEPADQWALPVSLVRENGVSTGAVFADMDGDGLPDLVYRERVRCTSGTSVWICDANIKVRLNKVREHPTNPWQLAPSFTNPAGWEGGMIDLTWPDRIVDMNGDGRADLVRFGPGETTLQVRFNTGSGWETPNPLSHDYSTASLTFLGAPQISQMRLEDVNRDGLPDIVAGSQNGLCHIGAYGINQGSNHFQNVVRPGSAQVFLSVWKALLPPECVRETFGTPPDKRVVGDLNGDGFRDVVSSWRTRIDHSVQPGGGCGGVISQCLCGADCSASGCFSLNGVPSCTCTCPAGTTVTDDPNIRFATGTGWTQNGIDPFIASLMPFRPHPNENPIPPTARPDFIYAMADLNGDGLADFVLNHSNGGQVLINNGAGFDALEGVTSWVDSAGPVENRRVPIVPTEDKDFPSEGAAFIDLDGDGVTDLVQAKNGSPARAWLNKFRPPVIKRFPNGLAQPNEVTYAAITTEAAKLDGTYDDTAIRPEAGMTFFITPVRVVASVSAEDGTAFGTTFTTTYRYDRMRGSAFGRGPQGFGAVTAIDGRNVIDGDAGSRKVTVTIYEQVFPYTGMPKQVERYVALGGIDGSRAYLTLTTTKYCDNIIACSDGQMYYQTGSSRFVYPRTIQDTSFFYDGEIPSLISLHRMVRTTDYRYDSDGNPTKTTVVTEIKDGCEDDYSSPSYNCQRHEKIVENHYEANPGSPATDLLRRLGKVTKSVVTSKSNVTTDPTGITHTTEFDYLSKSSFPPGDSSVQAVFLRRKRVEPGQSVPIQAHTVYEYDEFGNVTTIKDCGPDLDFCNFFPTALNSPSRVTSVSYMAADFTAPAGGRVTSLGYVNGRFPVMTKNALGQTEYTAYDPIHGNLIQKTGPNGIHSCMAYDNFGRQTSQTERCGTGQPELTTAIQRFWTTASDPSFTKVVTRTRAPTGVAAWAYSDSAGRTITTRGRTFDGGFSESVTFYDRWGRTAVQSVPRKSDSTDPTYVTVTKYDEADRLRTISRDLGDIDGSGTLRRAIQTLSYRGMTVRTEHNVDGEDAAHLRQQPREETKGVLGKVVRVVDANGLRDPNIGTIQFSYDADGNLTRTFDGLNNTHIEYYPDGRRKLTRDPDLGEWRYTYNAFGELETQTDGNGKAVSMTYDKVGRITSKKDVQTDQEAKWVYDTAPGAGIGKLAAIVSEPDTERLRGTCTPPLEAHLPLDAGKRAVRSFTYTPFGELADEVNCIDGEEFTTTRTYDNLGRERTVIYPQVASSRLSLRYNYTNLGFLYFVDDASDDSLYWAATARDAAGQVTSEYTRNGVETTSIRNQATGWLQGSSSVAHADGDTLIQNWSYRFDEVGNLRSRSRTDAVNGAPSHEAFTYDELNHLTGSAVAVGTDNYPETYDIDYRGNILRKGNKQYTYGAAGGCATGGPHAVCTVDGGAQYQYDANGNLLSGGDRSVTYNLANKVVEIQSGGNNVRFIYGADGNRVVQEATADGATARTIYVGLGATGKSFYERTTRSNGTVDHTHFLYAPGAHNGNAFAIKVRDGGSGKLLFNHFDHLGSVTAVSDERGQVVNAAFGGSEATVAGYDPWGARRAPDGRPAGSASFKPLPGHREFTGHETIPGVGLVNMNGRVYDPALGRFLSPDPNVQFVADLQSYNRYSYVLNNPLRYTDPTGYFMDSAAETFGYLFAITAVAVCTVATEGACAVAYVALIAYSTTTMAMSGASFDQIVEMQAVSIAAGLVGGAAVGAALGPGASIGAQMVGGAVSSVMSTAITAAVMGGDLGGEQVLVSAISGAVSAGVKASLRNTAKVTQATDGTAKGGRGGSGAERVETAETVDSVLKEAGHGRARPSAGEVLFDADMADYARSAAPPGDPVAGYGGAAANGPREAFNFVRGQVRYLQLRAIVAMGILDVSSRPDSAVFWSGPGNRVRAEAFAMGNAKVTLGMTKGGAWMLQQDLYNPKSGLTVDQATKIWGGLSRQFAQQASGRVDAFVNGAPKDGIWNTIELPALEKNPNIVMPPIYH